MDIKTLMAAAIEEALKQREASAKESDWLSPAEASRYLGVTAQHLQNLRARRKGPAFVKFGRLVRYARNDLNTYLENRKVKTENA